MRARAGEGPGVRLMETTDKPCTVFNLTPEEMPLYLAETDENLLILDEMFVEMESHPDSAGFRSAPQPAEEHPDSDPLQAAFRAAHTLKGLAGVINHHRMVRLTHELETALDGLRKRQYPLSPSLMNICLDAIDNLRLLREEVYSGKPAAVDIDEMVARFQEFQASAPNSPSLPPLPHSPLPHPSPTGRGARGEGLPPLASSGGESQKPAWVLAQIEESCIVPSARAFQMMLALQEMGEIASMEPSQQAIEAMTPARTFAAVILTHHTLDEIHEKLAGVSEVQFVKVYAEQPYDDSPANTLTPLATPHSPLASSRDEGLPPLPTPHSPLTSPVGEGLPPLATPRSPLASSGGEGANGKSSTRQQFPNADGKNRQMVRTSVQRLDQLVNLVGELITDRNRLNQIRNRMSVPTVTLNADRSGDMLIDQLSETVAHLGRITDQLQEEALHLRMMPIGSVMNKFPRLVRDLAQKLGKDVRLVLKGEDAELDRSVIEEISDPLIHLIRNAVDHGIETPEERKAQGKPPYGLITLTASHDQGHFILTIEDDGRGVNTSALVRKAIEKGLISEEEAGALPEDKAMELMYLPGISTASQVTDNSGRGVGMDIVRNNIQRINGTLLVESQLQKGTCIRIILPLTLAIVSSLMTRVAGTTFAIPLVMVSETLRVSRDALQTVMGRPVTLSRGMLLPLVDVAGTFHEAATAAYTGGSESGGSESGGADQNPANSDPYVWIVVVCAGRQQVGLVVDKLIGKEEVVIKSLGNLVGEITGISGAAILGDGEVALIIDVPGLLRSAGVS